MYLSVCISIDDSNIWGEKETVVLQPLFAWNSYLNCVYIVEWINELKKATKKEKHPESGEREIEIARKKMAKFTTSRNFSALCGFSVHVCGTVFFSSFIFGICNGMSWFALYVCERVCVCQ